MAFPRVASSLLCAGLLALFGATASHAQDRTHWIFDSSFSEETISGPESVRAGEVHSWTATARWTFSYDLLPGERIDLSGLALTFPEFTPPDDYLPADVTPFDAIVCEPDCSGSASFYLSFTATGPFDPPGVTTQPIYLIPMARMTSTSDPHGIHYYDFPIAVPRKRIEITAVPEPATWALMIGGFALVGTLARRRHTARAPFIES